MNAIALLQAAFGDLHREVRLDLAEVDAELLWWQPVAGTNHAGFLAWHLVRDEDTVVSHLAGSPQIWVSERWHDQFGMDAKGQGTGFEREGLGAFRYDLADLMGYAEQVWAATLPAVGALTEADLERPAWPGSEWTVAQQLMEGCVGHSWLHLGEIRYLKGMRGWRFRE